jgi:hypothetical protein
MRRLRGQSSGDGISPKRPELAPFGDLPFEPKLEPERAGQPS